MKAPFDTQIAECRDRLAEIGFVLAADSSHGATFARPDGFLLTVSLERYGEEFSVGIVPPAGRRTPLSALFLMEALDPARAREAKDAVRVGITALDRCLGWWNHFIEFLDSKADIIFKDPMDQEVLRRYDLVCRQRMQAMGME